MHATGIAHRNADPTIRGQPHQHSNDATGIAHQTAGPAIQGLTVQQDANYALSGLSQSYVSGKNNSIPFLVM